MDTLSEYERSGGMDILSVTECTRSESRDSSSTSAFSAGVSSTTSSIGVSSVVAATSGSHCGERGGVVGGESWNFVLPLLLPRSKRWEGEYPLQSRRSGCFRLQDRTAVSVSRSDYIARGSHGEAQSPGPLGHSHCVVTSSHHIHRTQYASV